MRRFLSVTLAASLLLGAISGCSSSWLQTVANNPAAVASSFSAQVQTVLSSAAILYTAASTLLPADKRANLDVAYEKAVLDITHALAALEDAAQVAQDAKQDHPNLQAEVNGVLSALKEMAVVVDGLRSIAVGAAHPSSPSGVGAAPTLDIAAACTDLDQRIAKIQQRHSH